MRIEPATMDDADAIADLWVDLASEQQAHGSHLAAAANRSTIRTAVGVHVVSGTLLVAMEGDCIVGFVMFEVETGALEQDVERGIIQNVYVEPDNRNKGVGTQLLEEAENALAAADVDVISLEAMAANDAARRFYRDRGYRPHRIEFERPVESDTHSKEDG